MQINPRTTAKDRVKMLEETGTKISVSTVKRVLYRHNLKGRESTPCDYYTMRLLHHAIITPCDYLRTAPRIQKHENNFQPGRWRHKSQK